MWMPLWVSERGPCVLAAQLSPGVGRRQLFTASVLGSEGKQGLAPLPIFSLTRGQHPEFCDSPPTPRNGNRIFGTSA